MTDQQWQAAWRLYQEAQDMPVSEARRFVETSGAEPVVAAEVFNLLSASTPPPLEAVLPPRLVRSGSIVGHYRVGEPFARGGMGEVYEATDTDLDRNIALKFLLPAAIGDAAATARFIREAKAVSQLNHPNIVTVYEVLQSEAGTAIAMERVDGVSLRQRCAAPVPLPLVAQWGSQIALALAVAHERGIVHRDIKPENVMVRTDGLVKVLDFGLARALDVSSKTSLTAAGLGLGTLRYASPEQLRGTTPSAAADVFSLGVVLYELATGEHPFEAEFTWETAYRITQVDPTPPSAVNPEIPQRLETLLLSMLDKDPVRRPPSASVAPLLEAVAAEVPYAPSRARRLLARVQSLLRRPARRRSALTQTVAVPTFFTGVATVATWALGPITGGHPTTLLVLGQLLSASVGGWPAGLVSTGLGILTFRLFFFSTAYNFLNVRSNTMVLAIVGVFFSVVFARRTPVR